MKLDYQQIMELPLPLDGADVGALDSIYSVYHYLVDKYTRALRGPREKKDCWMQRARFAYFAQRLAFNQRALRRAVRNLHKGEMTNFRLRVREWVLGCGERRLKIRGLIGEARIKKWHVKKLAHIERRPQNGHKLSLSTPIPDHVLEENLSPDANQHRQNEDSPKPFKRSEVRDWFRLPTLPRRAKTHSPKRAHMGMGLPSYLPKYGGMRRAVPSVVFWPHELAHDYVHGPKPHKEVPEKISERHDREGEGLACRESEYLPENMSDRLSLCAPNFPQFLHADSHIAKEWPD